MTGKNPISSENFFNIRTGSTRNGSTQLGSRNEKLRKYTSSAFEVPISRGSQRLVTDREKIN